MIELKCKECGTLVGNSENGIGENIDCYCEKHIPFWATECTNCGLIIGDTPIDNMEKYGWTYDGMNWFCPDCSPEESEEEVDEQKNDCKDCSYLVNGRCCICNTATDRTRHLEEKLANAEFTARALSTIMMTVSIIIAIVGIAVLVWSRMIR